MDQPESMGECSPKLSTYSKMLRYNGGSRQPEPGQAQPEESGVWMWMEGLKTCMCTEELVSEFPDRKTSIRLPVQCVPEVVSLGR